MRNFLFATLTIAAGGLIIGGMPSATAALLTVASYDMPNGDGGAHGGGANYWDGNYNGAGNPHQDGLSGGYLSGGTGALADGVIAANPFFDYFGLYPTAPYVGWLASPTIKFQFASAVTIGEIKLYVDNCHCAGVTSPSDIIVNGTDYAVPNWQYASPPLTIDITGLNITAKSVDVELVDPTYWVFMSEAQFFSSAVPELGSWAMMIIGFGGVAFRLRRGAGATAATI